MAGWISCLRNQPQSALGRRGAEPAQTPVVRSKEIMQHRGVAIQHEASAGEWRYSLRWAARRPAAKPERDCSFVQSVGSTIALIVSCIAVRKVRVDIAVDASVGCASSISAVLGSGMPVNPHIELDAHAPHWAQFAIGHRHQTTSGISPIFASAPGRASTRSHRSIPAGMVGRRAHANRLLGGQAALTATKPTPC